MTFAPKLQSSIASTNDSRLITYEVFIVRGSAVMNPSTSVHISRSEALSTEAKIEAV